MSLGAGIAFAGLSIAVAIMVVGGMVVTVWQAMAERRRETDLMIARVHANPDLYHELV